MTTVTTNSTKKAIKAPAAKKPAKKATVKKVAAKLSPIKVTIKAAKPAKVSVAKVAKPAEKPPVTKKQVGQFVSALEKLLNKAKKFIV